MIYFEKLTLTNEKEIEEMSAMATEIVREHFDPIIGKAQNDYMIAKFQTPAAIKEQLEHGSEYFFVSDGQRRMISAQDFIWMIMFIETVSKSV